MEDTEKIEKVKLIVVWEKIPSVNTLYQWTRRGLTKSKASRDFQTEAIKQFKSQFPDPLPFKKDDVFKISLQGFFRQRFWQRDVDNILKASIDALFTAMDINDSRVLEVEAKKSWIKGAKEEYISIVVEKSTWDYEFVDI